MSNVCHYGKFCRCVPSKMPLNQMSELPPQYAVEVLQSLSNYLIIYFRSAEAEINLNVTGHWPMRTAGQIVIKHFYPKCKKTMFREQTVHLNN